MAALLLDLRYVVNTAENFTLHFGMEEYWKLSDMKVELFKEKPERWCFIHVNRQEAFALIESLAGQLRRNDPNAGRLESRCRGDANWMSIAVNDNLEARKDTDLQIEDPLK